MRPKSSYRSEIAPVRRALQAWRKNRPNRRQPIPEGLWAQMALLARTHGVSAVSRALGLDYYALKRRVANPGSGAQFVEVSMTAGGHGLQVPPQG